ncbi:hypothetical protein [Cytobacillus sp. NCCP-133]|nr:hypothetical protein [Cytobacillus sp. NCCP-133]GLB60855.1 hypothetical protein NCCP133_29870 [Cytobacillus sp. NCCP-133]
MILRAMDLSLMAEHLNLHKDVICSSANVQSHIFSQIYEKKLTY